MQDDKVLFEKCCWDPDPTFPSTLHLSSLTTKPGPVMRACPAALPSCWFPLPRDTSHSPRSSAFLPLPTTLCVLCVSHTTTLFRHYLAMSVLGGPWLQEIHGNPTQTWQVTVIVQ